MKFQYANQSSLDSTCSTTNKGKQPVFSQPSQILSTKEVSSGSGQSKAEAIVFTGRQEANANPYAKPTRDKCYRRGETKHQSHSRPKQVTVNLVASKGKD